MEFIQISPRIYVKLSNLLHKSTFFTGELRDERFFLEPTNEKVIFIWDWEYLVVKKDISNKIRWHSIIPSLRMYTIILNSTELSSTDNLNKWNWIHWLTRNCQKEEDKSTETIKSTIPHFVQEEICTILLETQVG